MQCWTPDVNTNAALANSGFAIRHGYIIRKPNPKGTFSFAVPLEHILGCCEDYDKVVYGVRHTLTLVRTTDDNDAIFRAGAAAAGKVKLSKIS